LSKLKQLHSNLGEIRNISITWKILGKFQQTKPTLSKWQHLRSNLGQVEQLHSSWGNFKQLHWNLGIYKCFIVQL